MILTDYLSIAGLLLTLLGFTVTILNVRKARRLTEQLRGDLKRIDAASELSSAIACMTEIKTLHRMGQWFIVLDRYSSLRKSLILIRENNHDLNDESKKIIQSTISLLSAIEDIVEKSNNKKEPPEDVPKLNQIISKQMDKMHPILLELQNKIGR